MYSQNRSPWEIHEEMDRYLTKLSHVSATCRLTSEEELDIAYQCKSGTHIIRNRLNYLRALIGDKSPVILKPNSQRWGGQPWMKLRALTREFLDAHASQITRLHYKRPEGVVNTDLQSISPAAIAQALSGGNIFTGTILKDDACLNLLWDSQVVSDEESGSNRQLGFLFLYEVLQGKIQLSIGTQNCTRSLGEILTRLFQLKLARWGKETVDEGETDSSVSHQMAWLASMLECGAQAANWPSIPGDRESQACLTRGINLYAAQNRERGMIIKSFLDGVKNNFHGVAASSSHRELIQHQSAILNAARLHPMAIIGSVTPITTNIMDEPPSLSDNACSKRSLIVRDFSRDDGLTITVDDINSLAGFPLAPISLEQFVVYEASQERASTELPFNISQHPLSGSVVAQDMISRIKEDVANFAEAHNSQKVPRIANLTTDAIDQYARAPDSGGIQSAIDTLNELIALLTTLCCDDTSFMEASITQIVSDANSVDFSSPEATQFSLQRRIGRRSWLTMDFITGSLTSSKAIEDLLRVNPFAKDMPRTF